MLIVRIPWLSYNGAGACEVITIFLKESPILSRERISCSRFSSSGIR